MINPHPCPLQTIIFTGYHLVKAHILKGNHLPFQGALGWGPNWGRMVFRQGAASGEGKALQEIKMAGALAAQKNGVPGDAKGWAGTRCQRLGAAWAKQAMKS